MSEFQPFVVSLSNHERPNQKQRPQCTKQPKIPIHALNVDITRPLPYSPATCTSAPRTSHAAPDKKRKAESEARTQHGNFRAHFTQLAADCDKSLNEVLIALRASLIIPNILRADELNGEAI